MFYSNTLKSKMTPFLPAVDWPGEVTSQQNQTVQCTAEFFQLSSSERRCWDESRDNDAWQQYAGFLANWKHRIQGLLKDLKLQFSSTKTIDKKTSYSHCDHNHTTFKTVLKNVNKPIICNTQWEVFLSRQVNYNQVVVKCQILQECFLQNLICKNFKI